MRNLAKRAEFRICIWASFFVSTFLSCYILLLKISVFSDFLAEKILVKLNYDVYLYAINGYKSVNL